MGYGADVNPPPLAANQCDQCGERESKWECIDCARIFCPSCFDLLHKAAKKAGHTRHPLGTSQPVRTHAGPLARPFPTPAATHVPAAATIC